MKVIEIFDENYKIDKVYNRIRKATRAVIIDKDKLYMERTSSPQMVMLPGGGVEGGESNDECIARECKEECGLIVKPIKHLFAIREYYHDMIFYSVYVQCEIVGKCQKSLTDNEKSLNMTSGWQKCEDALNELNNLMQKYRNSDEELYGCHKREYLAIKEITNTYYV